MTADRDPIPAAPTPRTPQQAAAVHGHNQFATYDDEARVLAAERTEAWPLSVPCPQCGAPERTWCGSDVIDGVRQSRIGSVHDRRRTAADSALRTQDDQYLVYALLQPDHPLLPPVRRRLPRLALSRVADDIAQVRRQWHDPNDEVA